MGTSHRFQVAIKRVVGLVIISQKSGLSWVNGSVNWGFMAISSLIVSSVELCCYNRQKWTNGAENVTKHNHYEVIVDQLRHLLLLWAIDSEAPRRLIEVIKYPSFNLQ